MHGGTCQRGVDMRARLNSDVKALRGGEGPDRIRSGGDQHQLNVQDARGVMSRLSGKPPIYDHCGWHPYLDEKRGVDADAASCHGDASCCCIITHPLNPESARQSPCRLSCRAEHTT